MWCWHFTKEQKNKCVDWLEGTICSKNISPKSNGYLLRAFHMYSSVILIFILCFGPTWMVILATIFVIVIVVAFIVFRGCLLSMLETRLCQDDFNICDPILEYYSIEINNQNRMKLSLPVMILYLFLSLGIVFCRYGF